MCLAIPGRVSTVFDDGAAARAALVSFGGIERRVDLSFVPEARVGDYVLVHVGFAITTVDEEEALKVFEFLRQTEALAEEL